MPLSRDYQLGEKVRLVATFTNDDGAPTTPAAPVEVSIRPLNQSVDGPYAMTVQSEGVYEHVYTTANEGQHSFKVTTADGVIDVDQFYVEPLSF